MYHKYDYDRFFRSFQHFYTLYQHRNVELWEEYGRGQVSKEELNRQRFLYPLEAVGAGDAALAEAFLMISFGHSHKKSADAACV